MIVVIDNYDSFAINLYQLVAELHPDVRVFRNDTYTVDELIALNPEALIISPGPGRPSRAGICEDAVRAFDGKIPILGVCLGHQAIVEALGGTIVHAHRLVHGKRDSVYINEDCRDCPLFEGIASPFTAGRYHSLAVSKDSIPDDLRVIATSDDGEVMAVAHKSHPTFGLQFHPESILTPDGVRIVLNFLRLIPGYEPPATPIVSDGPISET